MNNEEYFLEKLKDSEESKEDNVIYGLTDRSKASLTNRINDFFIDRSKVSIKDKSYFFHMLAVMVDAGIPLVQALKSLAVRTKNIRFKRVLNTIAYGCESGATFSDAMSRFDDVFDDAEIGIVKSGEATGRLQTMLFKLSSNLDARHELNTKLWGAAVYPIVVLVVLFLVAVGMLVWVFPTLLNLLNEGGVSQAELPFSTKSLIFIQGFVVNYWWVLLTILALGYGIFAFYTGSSYGRLQWDYFKLNFPVAGKLLRNVYVLRFISLLGILVEAGLPILNALKIIQNSLGNKIYQMKVAEVVGNVQVGNKISDSLKGTDFLFPDEVVQMINVGEKSASISKVAEKVSAQYDREIANSLKKMTSVFEPVMILFVGVFVAFLAMSIMAPIFNLSSNVGF